MKSFNWTKIPPVKYSESIWKSLDEEKIHTTLKGETYAEFEELFAAREIRDSFFPIKDDTTVHISPKEIRFLDSKRSQSISIILLIIDIMLKAIKLDPRTIKNAILTLDTNTLPRFALKELLKLIPTEDEIASLKQHESRAKNLASAERFMMEVSEIIFYEQKLKAMHFKIAFTEYEDDAVTMINALGKSSREVITNHKLKEVLRVNIFLFNFEIILALGNYMNAGQRGGAYGFKISSVLTMMDTKSSISTRRHTLLHYLDELIRKKFPKVSGFENELTYVEEGSKGNN